MLRSMHPINRFSKTYRAVFIGGPFNKRVIYYPYDKEAKFCFNFKSWEKEFRHNHRFWEKSEPVNTEVVPDNAKPIHCFYFCIEEDLRVQEPQQIFQYRYSPEPNEHQTP